MILEEEVEEFLLVSPLYLVIVLHRVRLIRRILGRTALGEDRQREQPERKRERQASHVVLRRGAETCSHTTVGARKRSRRGFEAKRFERCAISCAKRYRPGPMARRLVPRRDMTDPLSSSSETINSLSPRRLTEGAHRDHQTRCQYARALHSIDRRSIARALPERRHEGHGHGS